MEGDLVGALLVEDGDGEHFPANLHRVDVGWQRDAGLQDEVRHSEVPVLDLVLLVGPDHGLHLHVVRDPELSADEGASCGEGGSEKKRLLVSRGGGEERGEGGRGRRN